MSKAKIFPSTGKPQAFEFIAKMDQDYFVVDSHLDQATQLKIIWGEYVDFSKLLPRDRLANEDDSCMELTLRNGKAFWTLVTETVTINGFNCWEQAFRIFSNIYTKKVSR